MGKFFEEIRQKSVREKSGIRQENLRGHTSEDVTRQRATTDEQGLSEIKGGVCARLAEGALTERTGTLLTQ